MLLTIVVVYAIYSTCRACGEVANASVRKTDIHQFDSDRALYGRIAQMVEQWTENPCVGSSILPLSTN